MVCSVTYYLPKKHEARQLRGRHDLDVQLELDHKLLKTTRHYENENGSLNIQHLGKTRYLQRYIPKMANRHRDMT